MSKNKRVIRGLSEIEKWDFKKCARKLEIWYHMKFCLVLLKYLSKYLHWCIFYLYVIVPK